MPHAARSVAVLQKYLEQAGTGDDGCSDSLSAPSGCEVAPQCFQSLHPRAVSSKQDVLQQFFTTSLPQALIGALGTFCSGKARPLHRYSIFKPLDI